MCVHYFDYFEILVDSNRLCLCQSILAQATVFVFMLGCFVTVEPWVTLQEVASHLQVAEDTVHRWVAKKGLPAVKAGRVWRFKLSEVDE
jgi:excisionase family DNA binding protein